MRNKISSFIGVSFFVCIVGFTVFMNLPKQDKDKEYRDFTEEELNDLWNFEDIDTKTEHASIVQVSKIIRDTSYVKSLSIVKQWNHSFINDNKEAVCFYGDVILYENDEGASDSKAVGYEVNAIQEVYKNYLSELGHLFIKYQIESIDSEMNGWEYTTIHLRDGRRIFLIKKEAEIIENYEKELIENATSINDSTKIIFPVAARKVKEKRKSHSPRQKEEKERINLFQDGIF